MDNKKWFDVIMLENRIDNIDGEFIGDETGIDRASTHRNRDEILIGRIRMYGEMLQNGMSEPRRIGKDLIDIANEADSIEKDIIFGWE